MHPKLSNRPLWHSIDAATPPSRNKGAGWGGTILVCAAVCCVIAFLLWAELMWGWVGP